MDALAIRSSREPVSYPSKAMLSERAPQPETIAATGLDRYTLAKLLAKHLLSAGELEFATLLQRLKLNGAVVEETLEFLRGDHYVEPRGSADGLGAILYALTERGRRFATEALMESSYTGPAPVPLDVYEQVVLSQSVHANRVTRAAMHEAFAEVVTPAEMLDELGPALHSGKAIFVYGDSGTGKTYLCRRLAWMLGGPVLIPYAIAAGGGVVEVYDPIAHNKIAGEDRRGDSARKDAWDKRFALCHRPAIVSGGELTLDMLEIRYDSVTKTQQPPMQLKANNGLYMIDDLGRQRVSTDALFNRWIVPLETRRDYLHIASGQRFPVPFDVILIFSTNLRPQDLADPAFLRRIGHKVRFQPMDTDAYAAIWRQVCDELQVTFDPELLEYVLAMHRRRGVSLLPCHPRDLIGMALDQSQYRDGDRRLTREALDLAWKNYFVTLDGAESADGHAPPANEYEAVRHD